MNAGLILLVFAIGFVAGLRSLTAPAAVAWAAYLGKLQLANTALAFMGSGVAVAIFTLLAVGELIGDKLPMTPKRTSMIPLLARIFSGGLCGACIAVAAGHTLAVNAAIGGVGAIAGAFAGYGIRRRIVAAGVKDFVVALCEDVVAVAAAIFIVR